MQTRNPNPHKKQDLKDYDGWVVTWLGHKNLPSHVQCAGCAVVKPAADFKYRVTRARSKAWNKAGNNAYYAVSKYCVDCRALVKPKVPLHEQPPEVLDKRVKSGDANPLVVSEILRKRHARAVSARRAGQEKRWLDEYKERWRPALTALDAEREFLRQALARYHNTLNPAHRTPAHEFYLGKYRAALNEVRARILFEFKRPLMRDRMPALTNWQMLLSDDTRAVLLRLHTAAGDALLHAAYPRKEWKWMNYGR